MLNTIRHVPSNPKLCGLSRLIPGVVYSSGQGKDLCMDILVPWTAERSGLSRRYPLVVFVQGSSWTSPDRGYEIPQLSALSRQGYVVATLEHRSIFDGYPFPAFLQDVKSAIRYLRVNADVYAIDSTRVAVWGSSSGGNAAMLVGLTGDDPRYQTAEYAEESDSVQAVVSCFGPSDITEIAWSARQLPGVGQLVRAAFGENEENWREAMDRFSPEKISCSGQRLPAFFLLHGDKDMEVPYQQMLRMRQHLSEMGAEVDAVCVDSAGHEWDFWSDEVFRLIADFLNSALA